MYTEKIVVEVGVNVSEEITARLPSELMELLAINGLWDEEFTESAQSPVSCLFFANIPLIRMSRHSLHSSWPGWRCSMLSMIQ